MGVISRIVGNFGSWLVQKANVSLPEKVQGVLSTQVRGFDEVYGHSQGRENFDKLVKRYVSWVYACANINAIAVASVPLRLYVTSQSKGQKFLTQTKAVDRKQKDYLFAEPSLQHKLLKAVDVEEVVEHPFLDLMQNVNPYMNAFDLIENWVLFQELTGNCYTLIIKDGLSVPTELWVLPAQNIRIVPSTERMIAGYLLGDDPATQQRFEPEEIMHMKYPNPNDIFYGKGPLAAAVLAADTHQGMSAHEWSLLNNNAIPPAALSTEQSLTTDQLKKIKDEWNAAYRGPNKAGKLAVLQGGLKIENIALSPKEMGYLLGQKVKREEIAAIFGVPMSLLTVEDIAAAPATGMIMGNISYSRRTIQPKCRRLEEKLNEQLLPLYDEKLFVAFDNPVPEDRAAKAVQREANLRSGYTTINEERLEENLEAVPWGEVPWMPVNLIPAGSPRPLQIPMENEEGQSKHINHINAFSPSLSRGGAASQVQSAPCNCKQLEPPLDMESLPDAAEQMAAIVRKMFRLQQKEMLAVMPIKSMGEEWLPNASKWVAWLTLKAKPVMSQLVSAGGKAGLEEIKSSLVFNASGPEIEAFINQWTYKFSFTVQENTIQELRAALQESSTLGETLGQKRDRVQTVFEDMEDYRAMRIARTESVRAINAGREEGWKQSEIIVGKEWWGADDMCEFCRALSVQYGPGTGGVPLGSNFTATNYGPVSEPPLHPNCRCRTLAVTKKEE